MTQANSKLSGATRPIIYICPSCYARIVEKGGDRCPPCNVLDAQRSLERESGLLRFPWPGIIFFAIFGIGLAIVMFLLAQIPK